MIPKLLPGDIILSRNKSFFSKIVVKFGKMKTGGCRVSHAALAIGGLVSPPQVIESLWKVTRGPLSKYEDQEIVVWRIMGTGIHERDELVLKCVSKEQNLYGALKIPLFALDSIFKTYFFTQTLGLSNFKVCSNLIAWTYQKTLNGKLFGVDWRSVQPDTIDDFCAEHGEKNPFEGYWFKEVYSSF